MNRRPQDGLGNKSGSSRKEKGVKISRKVNLIGYFLYIYMTPTSKGGPKQMTERK